MYEDFLHESDSFEKIKLEKKLTLLRKKSKSIIGYYGAIADWMDFELIEFCANHNPDWIFLFVGQVYPNVAIPKLANVVIWNKIDYDLLPTLLRMIDVAIVPFKINDITLNTSPVKIFEYMAGGKPIVSTRLPEVEKFGGVMTAETKVLFNELLARALAVKDDPEYLEILRQCSKINTWDNRIGTVINELNKRGILNDSMSSHCPS
jgi:hypothetical protein